MLYIQNFGIKTEKKIDENPETRQSPFRQWKWNWRKIEIKFTKIRDHWSKAREQPRKAEF